MASPLQSDSTSGRRFSSRRTALFLYVVLVGLPAVVFGALLFRQLTKDQNLLLAAQPEECRDAADRLGRATARRIRTVLYSEELRPFWEYRPSYFVDGRERIERRESPLLGSSQESGIVAWFSFHASGAGAATTPKVTVLRHRRQGGPDPVASAIEKLVYKEVAAPLFRTTRTPEDQVRRAEDEVRRAEEEEGYGRRKRELIRTVALNLSTGSLDECRAALDEVPSLQTVDEEDGLDRHTVHTQYLSLRVIERPGEAWPTVIALRSVAIPPWLPDPGLPSCIDRVAEAVHMIQGFVFDPRWLFQEMPIEVAGSVLGSSERLLLPGEAVSDDENVTVEDARLFEELRVELDIQSAIPENMLRVSIDASSLRRDFRVQNAWFGGMASILTISMMIGIRLLLSSIRASREEAQRTRNFVASVTHELRTPIAAVKLYGEMLHDGWVQGEDKRQEYLSRIVHESDRLDGLVDRVLLRRKLFDQGHHVEAGDLNEEILAQKADLEVVAGTKTGDVAFELAPGLPPVLVMPEGIHVVVQNLVENARKYAPVEMGPSGPSGEPILVRTRMSQKGNVLLEVLDRGPGIPEKDRRRIFEAFLRLGDESTRTTKGTGLGLHLVHLQARAMKGKVRALPRAGGGTVFQVHLKRA